MTAEEAIDDKDRSSHQQISGTNNDEGFGDDSGESAATALAATPPRVW